MKDIFKLKMSSTALGLALGLIIALNIMAINLHDQLPMQVELPCLNKTCDFSSLTPPMDADTVAFIEYMWTIRLRNLDLNVTELYFCGSNAMVQFDHCDVTQYYAILGFLVGSLIVICLYSCVIKFKMTGIKRRQVANSHALSPSETTDLLSHRPSSSDDKASEPPEYDEKN